MTAADDREVTPGPDLHTALEAAITARLEVARAAAKALTCGCHVGVLADAWQAIDSAVYLDNTTGHRVAGGDEWPAYLDPEVTAHIAQADPADAVRRYERDLRVLKRHAPIAAPHLGAVLICSYEWADGDGWDVLWAEHPPITDLLDVYPEVTRP